MDYVQVAGLLDLRTTYSDGTLDIESLVKLAKSRGFELVVLNDHDRMALEYGIAPFQNLLRARRELNSINSKGAANYLTAASNIKNSTPGVIVIPGSETAPFYYWTGSYLGKDLTAHNHERRILTAGLTKPEDYENLPILHNGFSTRYLKQSAFLLIAFLVPFVLGMLLIRTKGIVRRYGVAIVVLSTILIINADILRSSPFDQYHGDQGIAPYQLVIDYVNDRGGLTFWNYPETKSGKHKIDSVYFDTPPYPEVLLQSQNYTGFAAVYGDKITATEPKGIWDQVLLEYCLGRRDRPAWAIATSDFHEDGAAGEVLGNFVTVCLVKNKSAKELLSAMKDGRMYACRGKYPERIVLKDFSICGRKCDSKATMGQEITLSEHPIIHLSLTTTTPDKRPVHIRLIRSGEIIRELNATLPYSADYQDKYLRPDSKVFYRVDVLGAGLMVSNPIFVRFPA